MVVQNDIIERQKQIHISAYEWKFSRKGSLMHKSCSKGKHAQNKYGIQHQQNYMYLYEHMTANDHNKFFKSTNCQ